MVDESSSFRRDFGLVGRVERFGDGGLRVEPVTSGGDVEVIDDLMTVDNERRRGSARVAHGNDERRRRTSMHQG